MVFPPLYPAGRSHLRPLQLSDLRGFVRLFSDRQEYHLLWREIPTGLGSGAVLLSKYCKDRLLGKSSLFAVEFDGKMIGVIGFRVIHPEDYSAELVIFLEKGVRQQGVARSALRIIIGYGFRILGLNRIYFYVDPRNEVVLNSMEKLAPQAVHEGLLRQNEYIRGAFVDDHVYSILREDWAKADK
jgi:RimJ/RimL family protein N-acetyltransferase